MKSETSNKNNQPDMDKLAADTVVNGKDKDAMNSGKDNGDSPHKAKARPESLSLKAVIEEQATEDEAPQSRKFSLAKILGGDVLNTTFVRRQIWLLLLISAFLVVYIGCRYSCQQDLIQIDKLQVKLKDAKYKALSSTSQLTEISRESNVLNMLKESHDSVLKIPSQPPYKVDVPQEDK